MCFPVVGHKNLEGHIGFMCLLIVTISHPLQANMEASCVRETTQWECIFRDYIECAKERSFSPGDTMEKTHLVEVPDLCSPKTLL